MRTQHCFLFSSKTSVHHQIWQLEAFWEAISTFRGKLAIAVWHSGFQLPHSTRAWQPAAAAEYRMIQQRRMQPQRKPSAGADRANGR